ncbi:histidine phosphatase family protein [Micromonospora sp. WMMD1128]|uniref:histidine phosphatase family protein n=1 Tax=unclassified Micromonospora TaxID=2617518 RepID=UPI00248B6B96|nr:MULTISPECIES: histidine phosphatase family protein [unclassified Micromonospora]WBB74158.1 histidine phosphatase family protein [Micromonospora sp. WMMD1128]WFE32457.1 histidine phosphatase family protein [Micromonospora sp. WMMD975]
MPSRLLFLARHGEQDGAEVEGNTGLSARGRRQAALLGERLSGARIDAVHHGPLLRAAETAELVVAALPGVPVHCSDSVGDHLPHDTDPAGLPAAYARMLAGYDAAERADGPRRTAEAVARFAAVPAEGDVRELVVTHSFLIAWLVRHALDAPERRWLGLGLHNAGLTVIRFSAGGPPNLIAVNDVAHLPPELRGTGMPPDFVF